jgi:hypothetical protein
MASKSQNLGGKAASTRIGGGKPGVMPKGGPKLK